MGYFSIKMWVLTQSAGSFVFGITAKTVHSFICFVIIDQLYYKIFKSKEKTNKSTKYDLLDFQDFQFSLYIKNISDKTRTAHVKIKNFNNLIE